MTQLQGGIADRHAEPALARAREPASPSVVSDLVALTKPGIVRMVIVTTMVGFIASASAPGRGWTVTEAALAALWCLAGTMLSAAGANALNMAIEVSRDALMERTRRRPMPAGRLTRQTGALFGVLCSVAGVGVLWLGCNPAAAIVSAATIASYVLIYTPMKPLSTLSTIVGAVPGALPPLIGWAAGAPEAGGARSLLEPGGWTLFLIMFVWQIPHFLALAWKHREDYARAGHRVLPAEDPGGHRTAFIVLLWSVLLIPISLLPVQAMPERLGWAYAAIAFAGGVAHLAIAVRLVRARTDRAAMGLFLASIMYLPLLLLGLVGDALLPLPLQPHG